jgi:hypothetical protein
LHVCGVLVAVSLFTAGQPGQAAAPPASQSPAAAVAAAPPDPAPGTVPPTPTPAAGPPAPRRDGSADGAGLVFIHTVAPTEEPAWFWGILARPSQPGQPVRPTEDLCPEGHPLVETEAPFRSVWGAVDFRVIPDGRRVAPNGVPYHPIVCLDLDMNLWLWQRQGLYLFGYGRFWGMPDDNQTLLEGPKDGSQPSYRGLFNLSKREFDLLMGLAWNYWGALEARFFAYSLSNLNRGTSLTRPYGFNDGVGLENRLYLDPEYDRLGREGYDVSRASFLSLGYYPSKVMIGLDGNFFAPGPFARAYLTWDVPHTCCYLYADTQLICNSACTPKMLDADTGLAIVPFEGRRLLEFRLGAEVLADYQAGVVRTNAMPYIAVRLNY